MKSDPLKMSLLFDFYGDILTDKQRDFFDLYYNRDLSLGEIAENTGITRQGVRDVIVRASQSLESMEEKLSLVARHNAERNSFAEIKEAAAAIEAINGQRGGSVAIRDYARRIQELADQYFDRVQ